MGEEWMLLKLEPFLEEQDQASHGNSDPSQYWFPSERSNVEEIPSFISKRQRCFFNIVSCY